MNAPFNPNTSGDVVDLVRSILERVAVRKDAFELRLDDKTIEAIISQAKAGSYFPIKTPDGGVYMDRQWIIERDQSPLGWGARIHRIMRSDEDRHLHDHPWHNVSVILEGGYIELMPNDTMVLDALPEPMRSQVRDKAGEPLIAIVRKPGDVIYREDVTRHRLIIPNSGHATSLFLVGPKTQEWGFYTEKGKVLWTDYLEADGSTKSKYMS